MYFFDFFFKIVKRYRVIYLALYKFKKKLLLLLLLLLKQVTNKHVFSSGFSYNVNKSKYCPTIQSFGNQKPESTI